MINILNVGVGGQGSILSSRILGSLYLNAGLDVKVSEVHGMSQRGGSVVTYIRAGDQVASPLIPLGEADVIIAFELLEAYRYLPYLKKGGILVTNTQQINPMPVIIGAAAYPENILSELEQKGINVIAVDALKLAMTAGNSKASNLVMLGCASNVLDCSEDKWKEAIAQTVPEKFLKVNQKAFELGRCAAECMHCH